MGMVNAEIELRNPSRPELRPLTVQALVDTGAMTITGALVIGESVLLGAIPMEDMDLVLSPSGRTITVNPKSPNMPSAVVK